MTREAVGIIGPGAMGSPMAQQLIEAGRSVVYLSRSPKISLEERGATKAHSPKDLAEQASSILVMLPDLPQLELMLTGDDSLLAANLELFIMVGSTSSAVRVRELSEKLAEESDGRVQLIDSPVSGGVEGATAGTLSIMVGGTTEQYERARSVLAPCGTVHHLGPLGAGEVAKSCNQMVVAATMLALGEATVLGEQSGIAPEKLLEVLGGGYAGSTLLNSKKDMLINDDFTPGGIAAYMLKDLGFATDVAESTGANPILLPALLNSYQELVDAGLGNEDLAVVKKFIQQR